MDPRLKKFVERRRVGVGRRINEKFLDAYLTLDTVCGDKFGVAGGGVTEYINRLNEARFAEGRDNVLPKLVRYRAVRNRFAHEVGALRNVDELSGADVRWLKGFLRDINRKRDPISLYVKKARRYARQKKLRRALYALGGVAIAALAVALFIVLKG